MKAVMKEVIVIKGAIMGGKLSKKGRNGGFGSGGGI